MLLTEDQIERRVEQSYDLLDLRLIAGELTQEQYEAKSQAIRDWADREYRTVAKTD